MHVLLFPRVVRSREQPWAERLNPFGIDPLIAFPLSQL
jgi:hypothetical protein